MGGGDADERHTAHPHRCDGLGGGFQRGEPPFHASPGQRGLVEDYDAIALAVQSRDRRNEHGRTPGSLPDMILSEGVMLNRKGGASNSRRFMMNRGFPRVFQLCADSGMSFPCLLI
jgi:hypothetical protein